MKVMLVYPHFPNNTYKVPPLGLAYLVSYLRAYFQYNVDISVLDANALDLTTQETFEKVKAVAPDVLGLSVMTPQADFAYALTKSIKGWNAKTIVVHGGVHVTALPQASLYAGADCCVIGEGEATFLELLTLLTQRDAVIEQVAGLALMRNSEVIYTPTRPLIRNLDEVPLPAWDMFELSAYNENIHISTDYALPIMGSRGCPFHCSFCASPVMWRRRARFRSPTNVVAEIIENVTTYGINRFHFYDDSLLLKRTWIVEFCREIEKSALSCTWICLSRAADINRNLDLLPAVKSAGCCGFEIGVESGDEDVLRRINKDQHLAEVENAFFNIAEGGFEYLGIQLMTFNEGETVEGHRQQSRFFSKLFHAMRRYNIRLSAESRFPFLGQFATPYPGTPFYQSATQSGLVLASTWSDYVTTRVNYVPNTLLRHRVRLSNKPDEDKIETLRRVSSQRVFGGSDYGGGSISRLMEMLHLFIRLLGHGITLEEIAAVIKLEFDVDEYLAMKFASINLVALSQMGIVQTYTVKDMSTFIGRRENAKN
jgi:anaerobic magnesium-protoporphyrin IX monomethyl ester cyclase